MHIDISTAAHQRAARINKMHTLHDQGGLKSLKKSHFSLPEKRRSLEHLIRPCSAAFIKGVKP